MGEITHKEVFTALGTAIARMKEHHPGAYNTPVWGEKKTEHIKNLGFVIGYRDDAKMQWYRIDFDPVKQLHVNWECDTRASDGAKTRLKECYRVKPHILAPEDEMYTWWRSYTLHHTTELPAEIRQLMGGKHIWTGAFWR